MNKTKYILDTNVYIAAHSGYYNPDITINYWDILTDLGEKNIILSPKQVQDEISEANKWLSNWKKKNGIFLTSDLKGIINFYRDAIDAYKPVKKEHTDKIKRTDPYFRPGNEESLSDADFYVIACALFYKQNFPKQNYVIVTKENRSINKHKLVRIPHVCDALGIKCIDDFEFIKEIGIKFTADLT